MAIWFLLISLGVVGAVALISLLWEPAIWSLIVVVPIFLLGLYDMVQRRHAILRNFPVIGHFRYLFEMIRPEINQYFVESDIDGRPFNRVERSVVYQRAKQQLQTMPFGTRYDLYEEGSEWINHSIAPKKMPHDEPRVTIGKGRCDKPYSCSILNVSAMSYGSLSSAAVRAMNKGAKMGGFAQNTGEGGVAPHHLRHGGDLIWQLGTGYFGARAKDGGFDEGMFKENAAHESVRMIEIKISQGAKPGRGGILPGKKVTAEISKIRGVEMGKSVVSPPWHTAFTSPAELCEFAQKLRELSGGKPVGVKFCVGKRREFLSICKAMVETKLPLDFVTVDGSEGGTGAAPMEFSNSVGVPMIDGLIFVHNALTGTGLRSKVRVLAAGKIITGFQLVRVLAIGADIGMSARGMMMATGCIQALRCNANDCPTGVATHKPGLVRGLDVEDKARRVHHYHKDTVHTIMEILSAAGLQHPEELKPWHIHRRESRSDVRHYAQLYEYIGPGALLDGSEAKGYRRAWEEASVESWEK